MYFSCALTLLALCRCVVWLLDPHLEKMGWPVIENRLPYVPLHLGLTILGYTVQKRCVLRKNVGPST